MISIIIPVFQHQQLLLRCLEGIQKQTEKDIEVIVVDDGSHPPVSVQLDFSFPLTIMQIEHRGAPAARNIGFQKSRGEYVLFCDADISMHPQMLARMRRALEENPSAAYAFSSFRFGWKTFRLHPFDSDRLKRENYIHTTSLIRRDDVIPFDESLQRFQDWDLWLSLLEKGKEGVWVPEVLFSVKAGGTMSKWFPRRLYPAARFLRLPIRRIGEYESARKVVLKKHGLI